MIRTTYGKLLYERMPAVGGITAFIVLAVVSSNSFQHHFNSLSGRFGGHGDSYPHVINAAGWPSRRIGR
jgi:hypothetical protein